MKKSTLTLTMALSVCAITANAQENLTGSKLTDNWFIGISGGVYEPTAGSKFFGDMRPSIKLEVGRYLTPVFGLSASVQTGINDNNGNYRSHLFSTHKGGNAAFDYTNVGLNGLFNISNFFGGYNGAPRPFELVAEAGAGWGHFYGVSSSDSPKKDKNFISVNFGLGLNFNVSEALQINIKPAITYALNGKDGNNMNVNSSYLTFMAGVTYKFKNSNGTHNFQLSDKQYTQEQIDEMNDRINRMRGTYENVISDKDYAITNLKSQLAAEKAKDKTIIVNKTTTQLAPVVIFDQAKSVINKSQQPSVQMIATYMKNHPECTVTIKGYASPEGDKDFNQRLSEKRATAVYNMLVNTYKISPDRLKTEGLGATTEIFSENDWNRVCIFLENNAK